MIRILAVMVCVLMFAAWFYPASGNDDVLGKAREVVRDTAVDGLGYVVDALDEDSYAPETNEKLEAIFKPAAIVLLCILGVVVLMKLGNSG